MGSRCGQEELPPETEMLVTAGRFQPRDVREPYFIQYLSSLACDSSELYCSLRSCQHHRQLK